MIAAGYGYEGRPGQKRRLFATSRGGFVPIVWFNVGSDGSLYIGPHIPGATQVKTGTAKSDANGALSVEYDDGQPFREADRDPTKVSFHASGKLHFAGGSAVIPPLDTRNFEVPICSILAAQSVLQRPKARNEIRKTDIITEFEIDPACPVVCHVLYTVAAPHQLADRGRNEWKTLISYPAVERIGSAILEMTLVSGAPAPWPPDAYILMPAEDMRIHERPQTTDQAD